MTYAMLVLELPMYLSRIKDATRHKDVRIEICSDRSWSVYAYIVGNGFEYHVVIDGLAGTWISEDFHPKVEAWLEENK